MVVVRPMFLLPVWTVYMSASYHLISQAGWNICDLLYSTPPLPIRRLVRLLVGEMFRASAELLYRAWPFCSDFKCTQVAVLET